MPANFEFLLSVGPAASRSHSECRSTCGDEGHPRQLWLLAVGRHKGVSPTSRSGNEADLASSSRRRIPRPISKSGLSAAADRRGWRARRCSATRSVVAAVILVLVVASANLPSCSWRAAPGGKSNTPVSSRLARADRPDRLALTESAVVAVPASAWACSWRGMPTDCSRRSSCSLGRTAANIAITASCSRYCCCLRSSRRCGGACRPALTAARTDVRRDMNEGGLTQAGSGARHRFLRHLVGTQVAIALILANTALLRLVNHHAALASASRSRRNTCSRRNHA